MKAAKGLGTLVGAIVLATASGAWAVPIVFTSQAAWTAAVGGATVVTEDFEASPLGNIPLGVITDIGKFSVFIDQDVDAESGVFANGFVNGTHELRFDIDETQIGATLSSFDGAPIVGFAATWNSTTSADLLTMTVNGTTFQFDNFLAGSGDGFLGVVDPAGISTITFGRETQSTAGESFRLDNALLASPSLAQVPLPMTALLLGIGLAGIGIARRSRHA